MLACCLTWCYYFMIFRTINPVQCVTTVPLWDIMLNCKTGRWMNLQTIVPFLPVDIYL